MKLLHTRKLSGGLRATPYRNHSIRMPITVLMSRSIVSAMVTGLVTLTGLASGADVRGIITVQRKLTPRNVTPAAGLYQRGSPVALEADTRENALDYERSHVVVYLEGGSASVVTEPMPTEPMTAEMEQQNRRFSPDLVVIPAGASVSFPNFDPIFHNVFSLSKAKSFDLGNYPKGQTRTVTFAKAGVVYVYCHLHPNMAASIVVSPNQWSTRAHGSGRFTLPDVPPGKYTIVAWHKTAGTFRQPIEVTARGAADVKFFIPLGPEGVESAAKH